MSDRDLFAEVMTEMAEAEKRNSRKKICVRDLRVLPWKDTLGKPSVHCRLKEGAFIVFPYEGQWRVLFRPAGSQEDDTNFCPKTFKTKEAAQDEVAKNLRNFVRFYGTFPISQCSTQAAMSCC